MKVLPKDKLPKLPVRHSLLSRFRLHNSRLATWLPAMSFLRELYEKLRHGSTDSQSVLEARPNTYVCQDVVVRQEGLVLYRSNSASSQGDLAIPPKFDLVLEPVLSNNSQICFSLYRTLVGEEAQQVFAILKKVVPLLAELKPYEMMNKDTLELVCLTTRKNPTWSVAHVAAHFGFIEAFTNDLVLSHLNDVCPTSMSTPLHCALKAKQLPTVRHLLSLDTRLDLLDIECNSVFHFAAEAGKEYVQALASRSPLPINLLNERNSEGMSPLHLACLKDTDCAMELLRIGANPNLATLQGPSSPSPVSSESASNTGSPTKMKEFLDSNAHTMHSADVKLGGTPLHWAKTHQHIETLVSLGCELDAQNMEGNTALHIMVVRKRLPCLLALMHCGASVDIPGAGGNSPLHLAVKTMDISLVHALIVFGADVNAANDVGETPRHLVSSLAGELLFALHAVGAWRCQRRLDSCTKGCALDGDYNGIPPDKYPSTALPLYDRLFMGPLVSAALQRQKVSAPQDKKPVRLLCLDGGGIRGLILAQMLSTLEKLTGVALTQCFDWIAGTSTGGILALGLACGKTAAECRCLYFRLKDKVFVGSRPYDTELLEKFLQSELGETRCMADIVRPRVMVTGVLVDRRPIELHLFRNYPSAASMLGMEDDKASGNYARPAKPTEQLVWQAARASGAAPYYFRASGPFMDGGLMSNNPTLDALTEIHEINMASRFLNREEFQLELVVSLGTGKVPQCAVDHCDITWPGSSPWTVVKGAFSLSKMLIDQATQADGRVVDRAHAWCSMIQVPYFRLNPPLSEDVGLSETSNCVLVRMLWETMAYMHSKRQELAELVTLLIPHPAHFAEC